MPRFPIAIPTGHFMGLAPLDVWVRLLVACRGRIGPRYWLRLVCAMATSLLATLITLPERLVLWPVLAVKFRGREPRFVPGREAIVIVGYFRSGTTHLHNLLATHPDLVTPKWVQAMSPQGFWLSWAFLRLALVPFLPNTRPQDDVAFGPDWPAEDDFAHNNWALASSLPGRLVLTAERARWARFDSLDSLHERELTRWRRVMAAFAWKVSAGHGNRHLLLKSPSHTGKVRELDRVFGGRVRFVYIARNAEAVVRSNVSMHERLEGQSLQPLPDAASLREAVIGEYVEAEGRCFADEELLKAHRLQADATGDGGTGSDTRGTGFQPVRVRYDEFVTHPLDELSRICEAVGLRWDDCVVARAAAYLEAVGDYSPRQHTASDKETDPRLDALDQQLRRPGSPSRVEGTGSDSHSRLGEPGHQQLAGTESMGKSRPQTKQPRASQSLGLGVGDRARPWYRKQRVLGVLAVWIAAALGLGLWLGLAYLTERRLDVLAWPLGGAVGAVALRVAGRGDWKLGLWAAAGAFALVAASVWPLPAVASGWTGEDRLRNLATAYGTGNNNYLYLAFGMLTAYRYASRRFPKPPGI